MLRIYVGGLGLNVCEDDLRKTFGSTLLGSVESIEIIRTKGRSFAYLDFLPASDKGLSKLFSMYNGCMWKGGRLKLEKAKEHYLSRLQREWEEDVELTAKLSAQNVDGDEKTSLKPKIDRDMENVNLNIFFPKLRKIKPLPLKGSGKHKYSFQRVEVPPFPVHFCDCEEHSGPIESFIRNRATSQNNETETYGVNEEEINMMKSILDQILENENPSKTVPNESEPAVEINSNATSADHWQFEDTVEDQVSDEDNLVINIVDQSAKKQSSLSSAMELLSRPAQEMHGDQKQKLLLNKKRKQSDLLNDANDIKPPSKRKAKKSGDTVDDSVAVSKQPTHTESVSVQSIDDLERSKKSSWRNLVKAKENATFHISDILAIPNSQVVESHHTDADKFNDEDALDDKSSDVQFAKTSASPTDVKYARGSAWLQKSSWLQLIADKNESTFSITQVLPGVTFEKQELQEFDKNKASNIRKQQGIVHHNYLKPHTGDLNKTHERADDDPSPKKPDVDDLTKVQTHVSQHSQEPDLDAKKLCEKKNEFSDLMPESNLIPKDKKIVGGDIVVSETCPFMRNAASMKEWVKTKAALSGSSKRKTGKGKEQVQD